MKTLLLACSLTLMVIGLGAQEPTEFPHRKDFPTVPTISTADLKQGYDGDTILIVDVRSALEFEVIHPKKSVHIQYSKKDFLDKMREFVSANTGKTIAVYCNGITCLKSYKSCKACMDAGMTNIVAYDAGIPTWAALHPSETILLGKEVTDPAKQIIPKSVFKAQCLKFEDFKAAINDSTVVIDARDGIQRSDNLPDVKAKKIPMDKLIKNIVAKGEMKDKTLLIFDQVGKQVRWLEYYLKANGYENYKFLAGGATAVLGKQDYKK